jgi:hypothetical protein
MKNSNFKCVQILSLSFVQYKYTYQEQFSHACPQVGKTVYSSRMGTAALLYTAPPESGGRKITHDFSTQEQYFNF